MNMITKVKVAGWSHTKHWIIAKYTRRSASDPVHYSVDSRISNHLVALKVQSSHRRKIFLKVSDFFTRQLETRRNFWRFSDVKSPTWFRETVSDLLRIASFTSRSWQRNYPRHLCPSFIFRLFRLASKAKPSLCVVNETGMHSRCIRFFGCSNIQVSGCMWFRYKLIATNYLLKHSTLNLYYNVLKIYISVKNIILVLRYFFLNYVLVIVWLVPSLPLFA